MRKSITAVLLSAFLFPGTGHLYLRSYARGIILLTISAAALTDFIRRVWQIVDALRTQLIDEIGASGAIDLEALTAHAMVAVDKIDRQPFTITTLVLLACWLLAIYDSHRIGKQLEETPPSP